MPFSVLIEFDADYPDSDLEHVFGADILAEELLALLSYSQIKTVTNDLWRDFGWFIEVELNNFLFTVYLAKYGANEKWQMTIEPQVKISILGRLLGKREASYEPHLLHLSLLFEKYLNDSERVTNIYVFTTKNLKHCVNSVKELEW